MGRSYATVSPRFWTGETGRALRAEGRDAQLLALYLVTSPHGNMIGLYYLPLTLAAHELGMDLAELQAAMSAAENVGFCRYDWQREVVWVCEMARHQVAPSLSTTGRDRRRDGVMSLLRTMSDSPLAVAFVEHYDGAYGLRLNDGITAGLAGAWNGARAEVQSLEALGRGPRTPLEGSSKGPRRVLEPPSKPEIRDQRSEIREARSGADAPAPKSKSPRKGPAKPAAFPLGQAIDVLRKCPRIVLPQKLEKKHVGMLLALIDAAGSPAALERLGAWLMAGAEKHRDVIGLEELRVHGGTWLAAATRPETETPMPPRQRTQAPIPEGM